MAPLLTLNVTLNVTLNSLFFCPSVSLVNTLSRVDGNVEAMVADGAVESLVGLLDAHRDAAANTAGEGGGGGGGGGGGSSAAHQEQLLVGAASSCIANLTSCEGGMTAFMACGGVRQSIN